MLQLSTQPGHPASLDTHASEHLQQAHMRACLLVLAWHGVAPLVAGLQVLMQLGRLGGWAVAFMWRVSTILFLCCS